MIETWRFVVVVALLVVVGSLLPFVVEAAGHSTTVLMPERALAPREAAIVRGGGT